MSKCGERYDFYLGEYDKESCEDARNACLEDDSQRDRVTPESCANKPTLFCEREVAGNRYCWAYSDSENSEYTCQCVNHTDSETGTWYTQVDESDCELALDACIEQDAARE